MLNVGIVGGTGYTGVELLRLLARHPSARIRAITSRKEAGMPVADMFPSLRRVLDIAFSTPEEAGLDLVHQAEIAVIETRGQHRNQNAGPEGDEQRVGGDHQDVEGRKGVVQRAGQMNERCDQAQIG